MESQLAWDLLAPISHSSNLHLADHPHPCPPPRARRFPTPNLAVAHWRWSVPARGRPRGVWRKIQALTVTADPVVPLHLYRTGRWQCEAQHQVFLRRGDRGAALPTLWRRVVPPWRSAFLCYSVHSIVFACVSSIRPVASVSHPVVVRLVLLFCLFRDKEF
jgi:hypothetical protein